MNSTRIPEQEYFTLEHQDCLQLGHDILLLQRLTRRVRKLDFCLCENKGADQLCSNCTADQRLCFRYTDSTILLLLKLEISVFKPVSVTVQAGLCETWSGISYIMAHFILKSGKICVIGVQIVIRLGMMARSVSSM